MENATLSWSVGEGGFTFECKAENKLLPPEKWAQFKVSLPNGTHASLAPILCLVEDESATEVSGESIIVSHEDIAKFDNHDLESVGLPCNMPYSLSIEGKRLLTDSDFRFSYSIWHPEGRCVMGYERKGALLAVGNQQYIIPDPIYSLIKRMDSFNDKPPSDIEGRFFEWGSIKELLPEDIQIDRNLKGMNILRADAFTIKPYTNEHGEPDFDPILIYRKKTESLLSDKENLEIKETLPSARQTDFEKSFRKRKEVMSRYTAGGGYYVVLPESVRKVMSIAKRIQEETPGKRAEFIRNPTAFFRAELGDEFADTCLEALFHSQDDYGDRVKDVGAWQPKVLPYIESFNNEWLPDGAPGEENIGILIDEKPYSIIKDDVPELIEDLKNALKVGKQNVIYKGKSIPATEEALKAVQSLKAFAKPDVTDENKNTDTSENDNTTQIVLIIKDNLGNLEYKWGKRASNNTSNTIPGSLKWTLYPHQVDGVSGDLKIP